MITPEQLDDVLARQKEDGRRLGTMLIDNGFVSETQVTQILSQQLSVPWVSLYHIDFSRQLLNHVPQEVAENYCLVPIFVRRVRGVGECLYVAMDDPTNEKAHDEVSSFSGLPVRAMIAPPSDIKNAIRVYYGGGEPEPAPTPALAPTPAPQKAEPAAEEPKDEEPKHAEPATPQPSPPAKSGAASLAAVVEAASEELSTEVREAAEPPSVVPAREPSIPPPVRGTSSKMLELTLLDGTTVRLPAQGKKAPADDGAEAAQGGEQLTARDLVAALRAVSHGADATEILGDEARWEKLFAALLSVLLRKHLIADWEFVEEYKKI